MRHHESGVVLAQQIQNVSAAKGLVAYLQRMPDGTMEPMTTVYPETTKPPSSSAEDSGVSLISERQLT